VRDCSWLDYGASMLWEDGEYAPYYHPCYTPGGNVVIALVWNARDWPVPAEEICSLLKEYYAADPVEPPGLLGSEPWEYISTLEVAR